MSLLDSNLTSGFQPLPLSRVMQSQHQQLHPNLQSCFQPWKRKYSCNDEQKATLRTTPVSCTANSSSAMPDNRKLQYDANAKLVIIMVGLPARGKSYVTKKLCRYMNWLQYDAKIFNVGNRRRQLTSRGIDPPSHGQCHKLTDGPTNQPDDHSAEFFDPDNLESTRLREQVAMETLEELLDYLLRDGGSVAIFDATNSTIERREMIVQRINGRDSLIPIMFLESQCFDEILLESNMRLKLSGPDYKNESPELALEDFKKRVAMYEKKYQPLGDVEERLGYSYCQMIDVGRKFVMHNLRGFLATQAIHYLQHFNLLPRQIWLSRHGESHDDVVGRIGGDAELTPLGTKYATALSRFIEHEREMWNLRMQIRNTREPVHCRDILQRAAPHDPEIKQFQVWTSMMRRSMQTAQFFSNSNYHTQHLRMLDELNAGILEGLTRDEVKDFYSDWYMERQKNKLYHRYPGTAGEGYVDVTNRLKSVILEVERVTDHVLLISGLAVTRILLAYFRGLHRHEIADLHVPLGTLHMLEPKPYGVEYKVYVYNPKTDRFDLQG